MDITEAQLKLNKAVADWAEYCRTGQVNQKRADGELIGIKLMRAWEDFEGAATRLGARQTKRKED